MCTCPVPINRMSVICVSLRKTNAPICILIVIVRLIPHLNIIDKKYSS